MEVVEIESSGPHTVLVMAAGYSQSRCNDRKYKVSECSDIVGDRSQNVVGSRAETPRHDNMTVGD